MSKLLEIVEGANRRGSVVRLVVSRTFWSCHIELFIEPSRDDYEEEATDESPQVTSIHSPTPTDPILTAQPVLLIDEMRKLIEFQ